MSNRSASEAGPKARALRERLDLSLVAAGAASNRAHSKSAIDGLPSLTRAHSKSAIEGLPDLSETDRDRAEQLAGRLASTHSG